MKHFVILTSFFLGVNLNASIQDLLKDTSNLENAQANIEDMETDSYLPLSINSPFNNPDHPSLTPETLAIIDSLPPCSIDDLCKLIPASKPYEIHAKPTMDEIMRDPNYFGRLNNQAPMFINPLYKNTDNITPPRLAPARLHSHHPFHRARRDRNSTIELIKRAAQNRYHLNHLKWY